ncbi:MAG: sortase [Candidatus Peribacteraceae bacterium]|nr:sortase [Candidatus Peribacteraceae bacterium]
MQTKTKKPDLTCAEVERFHTELALAEAKIRKAILSARKQRGTLSELSKFGLTAAVIFVFVFVGMNFGAFAKRAEFLMAKVSSEEVTTTESSVAKKVTFQKPKLVVKKDAEESRLQLPELLDEIAPPDNRLIIPALGIHAPIKTATGVNLDAANWDDIEAQIQDALRDGVVNFPGTAKPGDQGNAFITGHSSYYPILPGRYKDIFALLPEIEIGTDIEVWQNEKKFTYRVNNKYEVSPSAVDVLENTENPQLTLMTCTPLGTALRRLIVTAELVESA